MKKLLLTAICAICVFGIASTAFAIPVEFFGQSWKAWGRTYSLAGVPDALNPNPKTYAPYLPDTPQTIPTDGTYKAADVVEDSFGVTEIQSIKYRDVPGTVWEQNVGSNELTVFFYGGDDVQIIPTGIPSLPFNLRTDGFIALFYLDSKDDFDDTQNASAARTSLTEFDTVSALDGSEGQLVLAVTGHTQYTDFDGQNLGNETEAYTLSSFGDITTGAFNGSILLDVIGGSWAQYYDTDTIEPGASYSYADFVLTISTLPTGANEWLVSGNPTMQGDLIPEPATMLLLGTGLVGVAGAARRKKKNQA